jgi:hypothetical protein
MEIEYCYFYNKLILKVLYQQSVDSHVAAPYVGTGQVDASWNLDPEAELVPI